MGSTILGILDWWYLSILILKARVSSKVWVAPGGASFPAGQFILLPKFWMRLDFRVWRPLIPIVSFELRWRLFGRELSVLGIAWASRPICFHRLYVINRIGSPVVVLLYFVSRGFEGMGNGCGHPWFQVFCS